MEEQFVLQYKQYSILCPSCGELCAKHSKVYENLVLHVGYTIEDALNSLNIMNPCTRTAMMNPPITKFNIQNPAVIEGRKLPHDINLREKKTFSMITPVFTKCNTKQNDIIEESDKNLELFSKESSSTTSEDESTEEETPIKIRKIKEKKIKQKSNKMDSKREGIQLDSLYDDLDEGGLPLEGEIKTFIKYPTRPGVPVINESPFIMPRNEYIGSGKYNTILVGRTYLAR